ncbi:MAG: M20 family metallopeptidase [Coprococcus sp.]|nr:M20 family metallopeptidase [Coprococcus sp.]
MNRKWEQEIEDFIEARRGEIVEQVSSLVKIQSVATEAVGGYPYGAACAQALDFCGDLARKNGLCVVNYDYYGLEIRPWEETKENGKRLLLAAHADVVPASEGNLYPAFGGVVDKGYIIGRGVVDDKGPLIALIYALIFLREQGIHPSCDVRLFVGSHEETDMEDLKYYLERAGQPAFGLAADDDFPVTNGEKSLLKFRVKSVSDYAGGSARFWEKLIQDTDGTLFGLDICSEQYGNTVCKATEEGSAEVPQNGEAKEKSAVVDIRLPLCQELGEAKERIRGELEGQGISVEFIREEPGYYISAEDGIPKLLVDLYHEVNGGEDPAYIMEGCTYARHFCKGCGFGAGNPHERKPFPQGHGGAHGPDEAHNIEVLLQAVKLDIMGVLAIADYWLSHE